jgi:hypothetical protein
VKKESKKQHPLRTNGKQILTLTPKEKKKELSEFYTNDFRLNN